MPLQTFTTLYPETGDPELLLLAKMAAAEGRLSLVTGFPIPANGAWLPAANTVEFSANSLAQYRIAPLGVFSWYDGAGGTRMTLNSNALAIGVTGVLGAGSLQFPVATQIGCQSDNFVFGSNSKYDGGWKYVTAGKAALQYQIITGQHLWFNSAVGVAVNDPITFVQAMTLAVGGNLLIGTTTNNANGGVLQLKSGITFPATQVAATDANTLDDYAETSFTPTIVGSTTAGTATYSSAAGRATKVGRLVTFSLRVIYSAGTGTGNLRVGGLPYTVGYASVCAIYAENIALTASYYPVASTVVSSATVAIEQLPTGGVAAASVPYDAAGDIQISGSYIV